MVQGIVLPIVGGEDSIPHTPWEWLVDVQEGRIKKEGACCAQLPTLNVLEHPQFQHQHRILTTTTPTLTLTPTLHPNDTDITF